MVLLYSLNTARKSQLQQKEKSFIFLWHCTFISATEDVCLFVDRQDQLPPNLHHPMFVLFLLTKSDLKIQIMFLSNSFSPFVSYPYWIMCFQFAVKMHTQHHFHPP